MNTAEEEYLEDLDSIASILADGYLRYRKNRRIDPLDLTGETSAHGHEVNASERGKRLAESDPCRD